MMRNPLENFLTKKVIISTDMQRENRVPPGQVITEKWPVLHYGPVPDYTEIEFDFKDIQFSVDKPMRFSWEDIPEITQG